MNIKEFCNKKVIFCSHCYIFSKNICSYSIKSVFLFVKNLMKFQKFEVGNIFFNEILLKYAQFLNLTIYEVLLCQIVLYKNLNF